MFIIVGRCVPKKVYDIQEMNNLNDLKHFLYLTKSLLIQFLDFWRKDLVCLTKNPFPLVIRYPRFQLL